ncbi:MAG: hypothetical protein A2Y57_01735 [Candidatus Woykebacteria bacterium RBG_13_40_7b]|uniref:Membrane insertase YidC/Oxa/ALB C-terminal domain-containing protein n=1 Tax=Candidatus Woykebacteria bacterium RBG_13_40_7b TaxID=1802594 RepID=A0A1G1WAW1_9BACT|nr:MAG: hypothetical protein A2Y57_01735 [Candidatus Woykebacteria bacterium RBG_13_40_7b]
MIDFFVDIILFLNKILFNNLGLTIIVLGTLTRLAFWPLFKSQMKHTKAMTDLKPKLDELKRRFKGDQKKQLEEQSKLFKSYGINPLGGCLPTIVQFAVIILLYQVLFKLFKMNVNTSFLIWDLSKPDIFKISSISFPIPGILVILTAVATFYQAKMMMPKPKAPTKDAGSDPMTMMSTQMVYLAPLMVLIFGTTFPSGLALYWTTTTFLTIIQQYYLLRSK